MNSEHRWPKAISLRPQVRAICRKQGAWFVNVLEGLQIWGKRPLIEECYRMSKAPRKCRDDTLTKSRHLQAAMYIGSRGKTHFFAYHLYFQYLSIPPFTSENRCIDFPHTNQFCDTSLESHNWTQFWCSNAESIRLYKTIPQDFPSFTSDANHNSNLLLMLLTVGL